MRNLPGFARFLPIAALFHGQVVNVAGLARDAGVARTTVGRLPGDPAGHLPRAHAAAPTRPGCGSRSASTRSSTGPTRAWCGR